MAHTEQFWLMAEEELLADGPSRQPQATEELQGDERSDP